MKASIVPPGFILTFNIKIKRTIIALSVLAAGNIITFASPMLFKSSQKISPYSQFGTATLLDNNVTPPFEKSFSLSRETYLLNDY